MCIICESNSAGERALVSHLEAGKAMAVAAAAMKVASERAMSTDGRKRYDRTHKAMVRMTRLWNGLEEQRERSTDQQIEG